MPLPNEIKEQLPEEIRENPTLNKYDSLEALASGMIEASSRLGNSIRIPGPDAGEEAQSEFYQKLMNNAPNLMLKPDFSEQEQADEFWKIMGKPEEVNGYTIPEGLEMPDNVVESARQIAFDSNMTPTQFEQFAQKLHGDYMAQNDQISEAKESDQKALKEEWGMAMEDRVALAAKMNDQFYPGRDFGTLTSAEIKGLYQIGQSVTGTGAQAAGQQANQASDHLTPEEARDRAEEIMKRIHAPNSDLSHAEKMRLIKKRTEILVKYAGLEGDPNAIGV